MSFRCSLATAPRLLKEPVVLRGTLTAKRLNQHRGFDLELVGSRVGEWTPSESVTPQLVALERATPKLSLERFLSKDAAKRLVLIGTKRAIEDVETTLRRGSKQSLGTRVSTTGLENLQAVIAEVAQKYDGLCFVRGGGDPHSFTTWNDSRLIAALINCGKPFYTALGHSNDLTLADKYADESFGTPSDLGSACTEAWRAHSGFFSMSAFNPIVHLLQPALQEADGHIDIGSAGRAVELSSRCRTSAHQQHDH